MSDSVKYFTEILIIKQLGDEGVLTEQQVSAAVALFHPSLGSFRDQAGALSWLAEQNIIDAGAVPVAPFMDGQNEYAAPGDLVAQPIDVTQLPWVMTSDQLYVHNLAWVDGLLHEGAIDQAQYDEALIRLKGSPYAFTWRDDVLQWVRAQFVPEMMLADCADVMVVDEAAALQLFTLLKNEVMSDDDYMDAYLKLSEAANRMRRFADAKECYQWLLQQDVLSYRVTDVAEAIHLTHNQRVLDDLFDQGLINRDSYFLALDELEGQSGVYHRDERAMLAWMSRAGLVVKAGAAKKKNGWGFTIFLVVLWCLWLMWS